MKVEITVTRIYDMDEERILSEPAFDPPSADASNAEKRRWLRESFFELCGWMRDEDHVNGSYVGLSADDEDAIFEWPKELR